MIDRQSPKAEVRMISLKGLQLLCFLFSVLILAGCAELAIHDTESLLLPRFQRSEVIGFVAGLGTTFAALPDLIGMLKRRSSKGMNPRMAAIMGVFQIVWVYYGLLILSRPVILWNIIAVGTNFISVGAYFYYARRER
jgi:MtN3 and saliva related transmembrane protein